MNELEQQEFDYSLVDNETVIKLEKYERQLNRIYNSYSVDVGEVLYHAQKELSNYGDGTFINWAESIGFKESSLYNYINAYKFLQKLEKPEDKETFLAQPKTLQYAMSKPSAKEEINQEVFNGNVKTSQEYKKMERKAKEYEKQLKQRDEQNAQLQSQVKQAQRSEKIARKQLEDAENREPEVIEREVVKEVVPDEVKQQLEQFKQKFERESNNANELRDELQRYRKSFSDPNQAYEEKELTRLERESSINAHKIAISIQNFIKENSVETYRLDTVIKANPKSKERLQENVALLKEFTANLEAMLNGRIVVN
ncbi:hypothetical protein [Staphylococcus capitis]|uniref:hypothetical protein n=1 Tax=Staphylococcus capitis TaxID=29388 RepID=UPI001D147345|nr:hypothetical protein [Staphylococcus capitis]MCC3755539.1 hypothetical protein [Staphylococcus capitis]MDH8729546.1 hypothetical protein [Staphylococcus capitis]MDH8729608.1 hypothetical protein [Staphylococcus capitis]MDH8923514.1 hypothetical protein [Staphylococcus capitis]MDH8944553.1 hypothetical protein [Staphylococcus capitis]